MGTRAYLSCTQFEELVPGHCLIVPIQHHLTMLEGDDDVWDEVRVRIKVHHPERDIADVRLHPELYEVSHAHVRRRG